MTPILVRNYAGNGVPQEEGSAEDKPSLIILNVDAISKVEREKIFGQMFVAINLSSGFALVREKEWIAEISSAKCERLSALWVALVNLSGKD